MVHPAKNMVWLGTRGSSSPWWRNSDATWGSPTPQCPLPTERSTPHIHGHREHLLKIRRAISILRSRNDLVQLSSHLPPRAILSCSSQSSSRPESGLNDAGVLAATRNLASLRLSLTAK